jgi:hypothetical protein
MYPQPSSKSKIPPVQDWPISDLPGLDSSVQVQLLELGISSTLQLWQQTTTPAKRNGLASQLQIHPQYVNKWAALADLSRLPSVGCHYCGLLLHAGIISPGQLAQMSFQQVHKQILRVQIKMLQRADLCPPLEEVKRWVQEARQIFNRDTKTSL